MTNNLDTREKTLSRMRRWREDADVEDELRPELEGKGEGMLHLKDLIPRILARWPWIVIGLFMGVSVGLLSVWRAVPIYRAKATLQVKDSNVSVVTGQTVTEELNLGTKSAMNTVMATVMRIELAEAVAEDEEVRNLRGLIPVEKPFFSMSKGKPETHEGREVPEPAKLAKKIQQWLNVSIRSDTRLIDVAVEHPEPEVAMLIANKMVSLFIEGREMKKKLGSTGSLEFLTSEAKRVSKSLQKTHAMLSSYATSLEAEKALVTAEEEVAVLKLRYRHKHPKMTEAMTRLENKQRHLAAMLERAVRNQSDVEYWTPHLARLGSPREPTAMREYRELLVSRSAVLQGEIQSESSFHQSLLDQKGSQEVTEKSAEAEVVQHGDARLPESPVYPIKSKLLIQATAVGLMAGVGLAFLFQYFDNKLHTVADVESAVGLAVLAAVADLDLEKAKENNEEKESLSWGGRERWAPTLLFQNGTSDSHYAEMFRVLRTSVSLLGPVNQRKVTMITSALPSEGKTFVAANLAVAMAQQGLRTLLVDFDLRKPSVHKMFGEDKDDRPGMADLLVGTAQPSEVLRTDTGEPNLSLILAGPKPPNAGELLESSRLVECLKMFRNHFDHIVLDTAPLLPVPDSRIIAPLADNRCLVVRAEATPRGAVRRAVNTLEASGVTPEGIVFNGYVEKRMLVGENYSYGYYKYGKYSYGGYGKVYGQDED